MAAHGNTSLPPSNTEEPEKVETDNKQKEIFNGWTLEQEKLYADWNEIASCCRWIHLQIEKIIHIKNVIIFYAKISNWFGPMVYKPIVNKHRARL